MSQFTGPAVPTFQFEAGTQTIEENKVVKPPLILETETFESGARISWRANQKAARSFKKQGELLAENRRVIHSLDIDGESVDSSPVNPAAIGQAVKADQ